MEGFFVLPAPKIGSIFGAGKLKTSHLRSSKPNIEEPLDFRFSDPKIKEPPIFDLRSEDSTGRAGVGRRRKQFFNLPIEKMGNGELFILPASKVEERVFPFSKPNFREHGYKSNP